MALYVDPDYWDEDYFEEIAPVTPVVVVAADERKRLGLDTAAGEAPRLGAPEDA